MAVVLLVVWVIVTLISPWARRVTNQIDAAVLRVIVDLHVEWLTKVMRAIDRVGIGWTVTVVGLSCSSPWSSSGAGATCSPSWPAS